MMRDNWVHFIPTLGVKPEANLQRTHSEPTANLLWSRFGGGDRLFIFYQKGQKRGATFVKKVWHRMTITITNQYFFLFI